MTETQSWPMVVFGALVDEYRDHGSIRRAVVSTARQLLAARRLLKGISEVAKINRRNTA